MGLDLLASTARAGAGERFTFTGSGVESLLHFYALEDDGAWLYRRATRRLAKGFGKSPFAALTAGEALRTRASTAAVRTLVAECAWHAGTMPRRRIYIGHIHVHPNVAFKIRNCAGGGCTEDEVREAFQSLTRPAEMFWRPGAEPPEIAGFGETAAGRKLFASMVALDVSDGSWSLVTAYPPG